jgi:hypothetical protein
VLSAKDQASLQSTISAYAASYKFMSRHVPGLRPAAIAVEAEAIASAQLAAEGQGAVSPEALLAFAALPEVQAEARRRVAARLQVTGKLEDLL